MTQNPNPQSRNVQPPEIETDRLISIVAEFLGPGTSATIAARALVEAEILDEPAFGLELLNERVAPGVPPEVRTVSGVGWVDASESFGPMAVATAAAHARAQGAQAGVGLCHATHVGRLGRLATYATWGAEQGYVTLVVADAPPAVVPAGGSTAVLGTNPLAVAVPGEPPLVIDFTTATSSELGSEAHVGPIEPRGGLIGTLAGLMVAILTSGVSGDPPSRADGRTVAVLMVAPRATADTAAWVENLTERFRLAGARVPGQRAGDILRNRLTIPAELQRWGPISEAVLEHLTGTPSKRSRSGRTTTGTT